MKKILFVFLACSALFFCFTSESCDDATPPSDKVAHDRQEKILQEGNAEVGMPSIVNFREKKMLKMIYELRDQASYVTYSYLYSQYSGKYIYIGQTIGYPIPYATQYTNPLQVVSGSYKESVTSIAQADPNGLFSPASAAGTWVALVDPKGKVVPGYFEPDVVCLPFKLPAYELVYTPPNY